MTCNLLFLEVAPMRGRGFGRGGGNQNRSDMFRSRAPNTSRPPSMHVDDFVKMANEAPPNMNMARRMPKVCRGLLFHETQLLLVHPFCVVSSP